MKTITSILIVSVSILFASCSSLEYDDPGRVETLTIEWGSTDLQTMAGEMVNSLGGAPALAYMDNGGKGDDKRVIMYVGDIENRTSEHIDTRSITDKMETQIIKSGRFRLVAADAGQTEIGDQVRFQQGSGRVTPEMRRSFGKQLGADVILYGVLRSISKRKGGSFETAGTDTKDVYYQFVLRCVNIDTGELIWIEEQELRKTRRTGIFGSN